MAAEGLNGRGTGGTPMQALLASAAREAGFLLRSPWDLALVTWIPCALLVLMAWLFSAGVPRGLPIAVVDLDHSATSRELVRRLHAAPGLDVAARPVSLEAAFSDARALRVYAVVHVPAGSGREVLRGGSATVFSWFNASYQVAGQAAERDIADAVQATSARLALTAVAPLRGPGSVRAAPVAAQTGVLFNPCRSYEHFLLALLFPAILHLALCVAVVGAFGRELRDATVQAWLGEGRGRLLVASTAGKLAPYLLLFTLYGCLGLAWLAGVRGGGVAGSATALVLGQLLLYLAYAAVALLLVAATRNMASALSLAGLYAGASLAYSGATFPTAGGSLFVRLWSELLPFTAYLKLQAQQMDVGSPLAVSARPAGAMLLYTMLVGAAGLLLYARAARDPAAWGRR